MSRRLFPERSDRACRPERNEYYDIEMTEVCGMEERSDDALCRAPAVPGILPPGKIVEGEKAAGVYEGAAPPVFTPKEKALCFPDFG
jgi:hypothetical protein